MKCFSTPPFELVTNFMSTKARNRCASHEYFYVVEKWPIQKEGSDKRLTEFVSSKLLPHAQK